MQAEVVTLVVGGMPYTAWKSMSVKYTFGSQEITFEIVASDEAPDLMSNAWRFEPGTPCQLLATGTLLVDGFIISRYPCSIWLTHDQCPQTCARNRLIKSR